MQFRSLRIRLTVWYFCIMAVTMIAVSLVAFLGMMRSIKTTVDEQLADRMTAIQQILDKHSRHAVLFDDDFALEAQLETEENLLQISDQDGRSLFRSGRLAPISLPMVQGLKSTANRYEDVTVGDAPFRMCSRLIAEKGHVYVVQVAEEMDDFVAALYRFEKLMFLLGPIPLAVASLAGYWLIRKAMNPLLEVTRAAKSITAEDLSARVAVPRTGDELQELAATFNTMLDRVEASVKRIAQFTSDASHELRTPVSILRARAEITLRRPRTAAQYEQTLRDMNEQIIRTSELLERLMLLALSDEGTATVSRCRLELSLMAIQTVADFAPVAERRGVRLEVRCSESELMVEGDPQSLVELIVILLDNALKYTAAGGSVIVYCEASGGVARLSVSDSGIGIAEQDLPFIFDRFYRADSARSRETGGAGLGLSVAKVIAAAHHGEITVRSQPGEGSTFVISLPMCN